MTKHGVHDLVALYVLDALPDDESRDFASHLAGCAECQREVADMRDVTEQLSSSVAAEPPASLRSSVLAGIAVTAQDAGGAATTADTRLPAGSRDNVVAFRPRLAGRVPQLMAAASILVAVVFGGWALQSRHDAQQATSQQSELVSLLGAGDVRTVSSSAAGGGSGTVVLSQARQRALFVSTGMPTLPGGKVYELWTITKRPVPAGTFTTGGGGLLVSLPAAALSADQIAVTIEPKGGSAQPTTSPVMAVSLPQSS